MVLKSLVVRQLGRRFPHLMAARLPVTVKAVIVSSDRRVLVLKKTGGAHDLPGGKVDAGETIEEAVAREVLEESGVRVRDVHYVANQPWPFPSQLMIGCHAFADNTDLVIDKTELEEAHWFTREEIGAAMAGDENGRLLTPPSVAIAYQLLKWWLEQ